MITKLWKINETMPDPDRIREAARLIRGGELVAFPTETVYGLGADALNPEGAKRIYAAKGRPSDNPLIVHIADFEALGRIAAYVPAQARALSDAFWPGPLTMIFRKTDEVPLATTGGLDTVAVRMPSHPVALALIRAAGGYIAAPSANTSGRPSPTLAGHVMQDLSGKIPLILDGGPVGIGIESTIIDLSGIDADGEAHGTHPMILRPGYITRSMVYDVIGEVEDDPALIAADSDIRPKAPGMKYKHYAPKADLILVSGSPDAVTRRINELAAESIRSGQKTGIICAQETEDAYHADAVKVIGERSDEDSIARHLYEILREFDDLGVERIYSESFATPRLGQAIMNRLKKAAGHQVIELEKG